MEAGNEQTVSICHMAIAQDKLKELYKSMKQPEEQVGVVGVKAYKELAEGTPKASTDPTAFQFGGFQVYSSTEIRPYEYKLMSKKEFNELREKGEI